MVGVGRDLVTRRSRGSIDAKRAVAVHIRGSPTLAVIVAPSIDVVASASRLGKCSSHVVWSCQACLHGGITEQALGSAQGIAGVPIIIIRTPGWRHVILDAGGGAHMCGAHKRAQECQSEGSHTRRGGGTKHHPCAGRPATARAGRIGACGQRIGARDRRPEPLPLAPPISAGRKRIGRRLACEGPGGRARWGCSPGGCPSTMQRSRSRRASRCPG